MREVLDQYGALIGGAIAAILCLVILIFIFITPDGPISDLFLQYIGIYL